ERFPGPADESSWNDERRRSAALQQPGWAGRIPGRVAARFEGGSQTTGRETRRVGFAFDELLTGKLGDCFTVGRRIQERIVFLGGDASERLEPVRVVRGAVFNGPVLYGFRDGVSH